MLLGNDARMESIRSRLDISCCARMKIRVFHPAQKIQGKMFFGLAFGSLEFLICCANSTPGLKSITVNKRKLNNKHTQRIQEFTWFGKLLTSTETTEKFHYKK